MPQVRKILESQHGAAGVLGDHPVLPYLYPGDAACDGCSNDAKTGRIVTVYIAGPMTGHPQHNYPAFAYVATVLRAKGVDARSPHEIDSGSMDRTWDWYMREALQMMLGCDEVVLLPGWRESKGATLEVHVAEALGMRVREWAGSVA
jgi:hypothetical protein